MPCFCVTARNACRKPGLGGIRRWNGSTMTPASSSFCSSIRLSTISMSLKAATSISSCTLLGMPAESGDGPRKVAGPLGRERHQRVVAHAVIAALELQDLVALAEGARGAHGVEIGLGAGADEAHLVGAGHGVADRLGERDAVAVVAEEGRAERHLRLHRRRHLGMGVADEHRAGAQQEVDIFAARLVPDAAALAFRAGPPRPACCRSCRPAGRAWPARRGRWWDRGRSGRSWFSSLQTLCLTRSARRSNGASCPRWPWRNGPCRTCPRPAAPRPRR